MLFADLKTINQIPQITHWDTPLTIHTHPVEDFGKWTTKGCEFSKAHTKTFYIGT